MSTSTITPIASGGDRDNQPNREFLFARIGSRWVALPATRVLEVSRIPRLVPVREGRTLVAGVANLRGQVVPVLDVHGRFGDLEGDSTAPDGRLLVVELGGQQVALRVDQTENGLRTVPPTDIAPAVDRLDGSYPSWVLGLAPHEAGPAQVILLDRLFTPAELKIVSAIREAF